MGSCKVFFWRAFYIDFFSLKEELGDVSNIRMVL